MTKPSDQSSCMSSRNPLLSPLCPEISHRVPALGCQPIASPSKLVRWLKFNFVGAIGIVVQFVALFLLKGVLHLHYLAATAIAVESAVLHNFIWHEQFTWVDRTRRHRRKCEWPTRRGMLLRGLRFHLGNGAVSILGNLALMKVMVGQGRMNYLVANAVAITLCSVVNFLVSDEWVFEE